MTPVELVRQGAFVPNLLMFGRLLRRAGLDVPHRRLLDAARALELVGLTRRPDVHATMSALLVHRAEDRERFDRAFDLFFRVPSQSAPGASNLDRRAAPQAIARPIVGQPPEAGNADADGTEEPAWAVGASSPEGVSRTKDFADFTVSELERARRLLERLPWQLGVRTTRRWERASGSAPDLRRAIRRAVMQGELLALPTRRRRRTPRPVVVLGDVSGSMERYSRVLLHFIYGMAHGARHVESFVFATTLTRITRSVARQGADHALARVRRDVRDWGGGTRIGGSLRTFNTRWARRVMRHTPVVVILSDGWDRGEPAVLAGELARLRRMCRRLVWLNPLLGDARYEPLTRGMQAALPHIDDFLPAHNLASLERLVTVLGQLRGPR